VLFYHGHVSAAAVGAMLIAMFLGALAWAAAATAMTGLIPTAESANPIFMLVYFPVVFISGALGAISALPHWLTTLASYLPAEPMVDALTGSLRHAAGAPFLPGRDVAVLVAWAVAGIVAAVILFRWEPHRPAVKRPARARA
jgi:ABC-2 type transport system permease protein